MGDNKAHSYNNRYRLLSQPQIEKVTEQELSISLRKEIDDSFEHIYDEETHITQEERQRWRVLERVASDA